MTSYYFNQYSTNGAKDKVQLNMRDNIIERRNWIIFFNNNKGSACAVDVNKKM